VTASRHVGLFEISTHENCLEDLTKMAAQDGFTVTVFCSEAVHDRMPEALLSRNKVSWVTKGSDESVGQFLGRVSEHSRDLDLLYLLPLSGTVVDFLHYARFRSACPVALSVFNANAWVAPNLRLTPKVYNYFRLALRRRIVSQVDALVLEYDTIREYAQERTTTPTYTLTPAMFDTPPARPDDSRVQWTIPGMIDGRRRDYGVVLDALSKLDPRHKDQLKLRLLGRPVGNGTEIVDQFNTLAERGWNISYDDEWIPVDRFRRTLRETDILLAPLHERKPHGASVESYGTTKTTGALCDMVRYGLPLTLPSTYRPPSGLEAGIQQYEGSQGLAGLIERSMVDDNHRRSLQDAALEGAKAYDLKAQQHRFRDLIEELIANRR
jgi:hypothetical protein